MKIVQLHPRESAAARRDGAPDFEPDGAHSNTTKDDAGAARPPGRDEPDGKPSQSPSGARDHATAPRQLVRKTVITIKRKKLRRARTPAEILARSLDSPHLKIKRSAPPGILDTPAARPTRPLTQPATLQGRNGSFGGDQFWQIWLSHQTYLRAHALRFSGGNFADAEDALSEAMLKAAQTFQGSAIHNHRAWLLRLVHNACMDRHRSNRRRSRLAKDITDADAQSAPAVAIGPDRSPEELLCALQQIDDLQRAMTALPSFLAEPFLRYLDDQPDAEIADSLHVTKEVIRKRRQIVRAMLRRCIAP